MYEAEGGSPRPGLDFGKIEPEVSGTEEWRSTGSTASFNVENVYENAMDKEYEKLRKSLAEDFKDYLIEETKQWYDVGPFEILGYEIGPVPIGISASPIVNGEEVWAPRIGEERLSELAASYLEEVESGSEPFGLEGR